MFETGNRFRSGLAVASATIAVASGIALERTGVLADAKTQIQHLIFPNRHINLPPSLLRGISGSLNDLQDGYDKHYKLTPDLTPDSIQD